MVVVPNDIAYPLRQYVETLSIRRIPWVLMQEGILLPLPPSRVAFYGSRGASAIAAWGDAYLPYFSQVGAPPASIHAVGSPRYDSYARDIYAPAAVELRVRHAANCTTLLAFLTTPVDKPGGHCTTDEKLASVAQLLAGLVPVADRRGLRLLIKPHRGEDVRGYERVLNESGLRSRSRLVLDVDPHALMTAADAVLVNGSTSGLEALMLGARLGVVPVPRSGYVHDFLEARVATAIDPSRDPAADLEDLMYAEQEPDALAGYLNHHLANRGTAGDAVAALVDETTRLCIPH
ncbi:MAG: hypothetical protein AB1673_10870 [Actinomycetota bacterium]